VGHQTASEIIDLRNPNLSTAQIAQKPQTRGASGGSSGPVSSESEGALSRSYAVMASSSDWGTTAWGLELQTLTKSLIVMPRNRMMA
jgi:hypothetical protein